MANKVLNVVLGGVSGWAGSALAAGIAEADDMRLVGGVSRRHAGDTVGALPGFPEGTKDADAPVFETVGEALAGEGCPLPDVYVEYTQPEAAFDHVRQALEAGVHVVIGTSGLTEDDFLRIATMARARNLGVLACGNFSITAELLQQFSEQAARWLPSWEIIDYAPAGKPDAPSGTARELASRMARVARPQVEVPPGDVQGPEGARGAELGGMQVHSVRLPGFVLSVETVFGLPSERLCLRHDAGESAQPYVGGALLAIRGVPRLSGLHRGLSTVMSE